MADCWISVGLQLTRKGKDTRKAPSIQSERWMIGKEKDLGLDRLLWNACKHISDFYLAAISEEEVTDGEVNEMFRRVGATIEGWTVGGDKEEVSDDAG